MARVVIVSQKNPSKRKLVRPLEASVLVRLGRWRYETAAMAPAEPFVAPEVKDLAAPVVEIPEPLGLDAVPFASKIARERAESLGLDPEAFVGQEGSGLGGAFTTPDVMRISGEGA